MKEYKIKSYCGECTNYSFSKCVVDEEGNYYATPEFFYQVNEDGEPDYEQEPIAYFACVSDLEEPVEFATCEEMEKYIEDYCEKLNNIEKSKLNCLRRNAKRRLKKELCNYVKRNAEMMGWPVKFFRNACLLAVSHYEVSIDEVMNRELMFAV